MSYERGGRGPEGPGGGSGRSGTYRTADPPWLVALRRFTRRHGWRAYALPVLVVLTVVGLTTASSGRHSPAAAGPVTKTSAVSTPSTAPDPSITPSVAPSTRARSAPATRTSPSPSKSAGPASPRSTGAAPSNRTSARSTPAGSAPGHAAGQAESVSVDALPPGPAYSTTGDGTFRVLPGRSAVVGRGPVRRYVVEVENGVSGVDLKAYAAAVVATLGDRRSWTSNGVVSFQRVAHADKADFRVALTSSMTVRTLCGYEQKIETSCWQDTHGPSRVNLNVARWVRGDSQFGPDLAAYRVYMINHEVGHAIGHQHAFTCLANGLAPVMMQQTITLKENQGLGPKTCRPNPWPFPPGVDPRFAVTS